jgi:hypothetical protein
VDNRVLTSDGTANSANAETNLTFDGSTLAVTGKVTATTFTGSLQDFEHDANANTTFGIGIGRGASGNITYGIGIGYLADGNSSYGIGIGYDSDDNTNYGVGIGAYATSNTKGPGSVALGSYSKVQRFNEIVSAANENVSNKSLSIIQKFRDQSVVGPFAIVELFLDGTGERLTIQPSSIYHFHIQVNAIDQTTFDCKSWQFTGAIKRDNANNTVMVGNSPNQIVTSYDVGAANWNVDVAASNLYDALILTALTDTSNTVKFSATIWATETRI